MSAHLDHMRDYLVQGNLVSQNNIAADRSAVSCLCVLPFGCFND